MIRSRIYRNKAIKDLEGLKIGNKTYREGNNFSIENVGLALLEMPI